LSSMAKNCPNNVFRKVEKRSRCAARRCRSREGCPVRTASQAAIRATATVCELGKSGKPDDAPGQQERRLASPRRGRRVHVRSDDAGPGNCAGDPYRGGNLGGWRRASLPQGQHRRHPRNPRHGRAPTPPLPRFAHCEEAFPAGQLPAPCGCEAPIFRDIAAMRF
jgi:hypothetical protein